MLKTHISTSVWSVQHPNAGQNIQQTSNQLSVLSNKCMHICYTDPCTAQLAHWPATHLTPPNTTHLNYTILLLAPVWYIYLLQLGSSGVCIQLHSWRFEDTLNLPSQIHFHFWMQPLYLRSHKSQTKELQIILGDVESQIQCNLWIIWSDLGTMIVI